MMTTKKSISNVHILPLKGTRIETWFLGALKEARNKSLASMQVYLRTHVPEQFHTHLTKGINRRLSR